jgi:hypothetical protein
MGNKIDERDERLFAMLAMTGLSVILGNTCEIRFLLKVTGLQL